MSKQYTIQDMMNADNSLYVESVMGAGTPQDVLAQHSLTRLAWRARKFFYLLKEGGLVGKVQIARITWEEREGNTSFTITNPAAASLPAIYRSFKIITRLGFTGNSKADIARVKVGEEDSPITLDMNSTPAQMVNTLYAAVASIVGQHKWHDVREAFPDVKTHAHRVEFVRNATRGVNIYFSGENAQRVQALIRDTTLTNVLPMVRGVGMPLDPNYDNFLTDHLLKDFGGQFTEVMEYFYTQVGAVTDKMVVPRNL